MTTWTEFDEAAPGLAGLVRGRIEATGLGLLATLRKDGSPRISGVEPSFFEGELWLGMMDGSLKARDLQRDPRLALHNATVDKEVTEGDVRVSGRAVEVSDASTKQAYLASFRETNGQGPPDDSPMHLFKIDITDVVSIKPGGDHLVIQSWTPAQGLRRVERK
jgi:hypothetical protein